MHDRCDRCGGRPHLRAERDVEVLVLCLTHAMTHGPALKAQGWDVSLVAEPAAHA